MKKHKSIINNQLSPQGAEEKNSAGTQRAEAARKQNGRSCVRAAVSL